MFWLSACWQGLLIGLWIILCALSVFWVTLTETLPLLILLTAIQISLCAGFFLAATNFTLLFIFYETSLVPILLVVLVFGAQVDRLSALNYLALFTFSISLPVFVAAFFDGHDFHALFGAFYAFLIAVGFLVKFPVYFLHVWLPKAHVERPTIGSCLLAGLMLKLGTVGFYVLVAAQTHIAAQNFLVLAAFVGFAGMLFGCLECCFSCDLKSLLACSSVAHMGFVFLALSDFYAAGFAGSLMLMLFHGFVRPLMFFTAAIFYRQNFSRLLYYQNGLLGILVLLSGLLALAFLMNFRVPPSLCFLSELLMLTAPIHAGSFGLLVAYVMLVCYFNVFVTASIISGCVSFPAV